MTEPQQEQQVEPEEEPVEEDPLAIVMRERDEYLDALQRLKAEFDNYRKRVARDQQELAARAHERLIREVLPVLDDLERALAQFRSGVGEADPSATDRLRRAYADGDVEEGIRLIHRQLSDSLAREGLTEVPTDGKFDPHTQEALLSQPSDKDEGDVIEVLQKGYKLGDRVLRPARVVVSQGADGQ